MELTICAGCAGADALATAVGAACPDVRISRAACLSVCDRPASLAAQEAGRATYVFAGLEAGHAAEIADFVEAWRAAAGGWIEDARPLGDLRFRLVTRIPAMS